MKIFPWLRSRPSPAARMSVSPDVSSAAPREIFLAMAEELDADASVLEMGTKQAVVGTSSHWQQRFPNVKRANYVMADLLPGPDVDVVADLHGLPADWGERFDVVLAGAVFEHLERPWIAAREVFRVLKPGGACYIATHQTFPLHAYPHDYFRFSKEALALLFEDVGFDVVETAYEHRVELKPPAAIVPKKLQEAWNAEWPCYLCVHLYAVKPEALVDDV